jgi:hypothetical protein
MAKATKKLLSKLQSIEELDFALTCWCTDEKKDPEEYELSDLIDLARCRLEKFYEPGHTLWESMNGQHGDEERRWATKQVTSIQKWIKSAKMELAKAVS